jgi:hypothetical protein
MTTPEYVPESVSEFVTASRRAQGLPDRIVDPAALARVAALLVAGVAEEAQGRGPKVPYGIGGDA